MRKANWYKSWDESCYPFVGLQLQKIIDPVWIVHILQSLVSKRVVGVYELLEGISEIILIRKIPKFIWKQLIQSFQVFFILLALFFSEAEVLHFEYLKYLSMKDLSDERSFSDSNKIAIDFHLNDSINCFDLYFLNWSKDYLFKVMIFRFLRYFFRWGIWEGPRVMKRDTVLDYNRIFWIRVVPDCFRWLVPC